MKPETLLLMDKSPILRYLVLTKLLDYDVENKEVKELSSLKDGDPMFAFLRKKQKKNGSWSTIGFPTKKRFLNTIHGLSRLAYLGYSIEDDFVHRAAEFLLKSQQEDGSWLLSNYRSPDLADDVSEKMVVPFQTALPLASLIKVGMENDSRIQNGLKWLEKYQLPDTSWPAKITPEGEYPYQLVGYRKMPNSSFGCRTNTTQALICYSYLNNKKRKLKVRKTIDMLLSRETRERQYIGLETTRILGFEEPRGVFTYHGRFDLGLLLSLATNLGVTLDDPRIQNLVEYITSIRGKYGLWEYPSNPQASRWVSFDLMKSLKQISKDGDWQTQTPRLNYQSYLRMPKRY